MPKEECLLAGDYTPCSEVSLSEVVSFINKWVAGQATLSQVIALINAWASPSIFMMTSSAFANNGNIPLKYTCDGQDVNPPLSISGIPPSAQTMALVVDDPDAPGETFDHWVMWNISLLSDIAENSVPAGAVQGVNGFGENKYAGPCPPIGETHRYRFKLYALDDFLNLASTSDAAALKGAMAGHVIRQANLTGLYTA